MAMQTFDLVVVHPMTVGVWRASPHRKLLLAASLAAVALGAGAWLTRPPADSTTAAAPKLAGRIAVAPQRAPTEDEARLAAYQQAVALSFVKPLAAPEADSLADSAAAKPAHPRGRVAPMAAKRDARATAPLPPPRPTTPVATAVDAPPPVAPPPDAPPQVIFADLPAAPPPAADPGYFDASLQAMAGVGRGVARVPGATRDLAVATVDRLGGTLFAVGARLGF